MLSLYTRTYFGWFEHVAIRASQPAEQGPYLASLTSLMRMDVTNIHAGRVLDRAAYPFHVSQSKCVHPRRARVLIRVLRIPILDRNAPRQRLTESIDDLRE